MVLAREFAKQPSKKNRLFLCSQTNKRNTTGKAPRLGTYLSVENLTNEREHGDDVALLPAYVINLSVKVRSAFHYVALPGFQSVNCPVKSSSPVRESTRLKDKRIQRAPMTLRSCRTSTLKPTD